MVPAIVGWSIPAIAGYVNSVRQRKVLRNFVAKILQIHITTIKDKERHNKLLDNVRIEIIQKLTEGKISESKYDILNNKI